MTDWELLQQYLQSRSQEAFGELVRRHIGWVRAAALRQVRDAHLADDVAQAVFLALAQQAHRLHEGATLSTWLFQVTRYAASTALRTESRRKRHERQAAMTPHSDDRSMTLEQWEQLSPVLDKLVARLRSDDRRAVLLRFYEQKSYPDMAAVLGVSEDAARKRTDRAVDKLRQLIGNRELTLSAGALSAGLLAHATGPASPTLAAAAIDVASRGPAAATPVAAIAKGAIQMMNLMKLRVPLAAGAALLVFAAVGVTVLSGGEPASATGAAARPGVAAPRAAAAATTASATTAPAVVREDSPKAVVFAAFRAAAAGDADGLISRFERVTPAQAYTLRQTSAVMTAAHQLAKAAGERFGPEVEQQFARGLGMGVGEFDVTSAMETIQGDTAMVEMKVGPGDVRLVRSGATWKISADALGTLNAGGVRQMAARIPAIEQLTADIRAGKYQTREELNQTVGALMRPNRRRPATTTTAAPAAAPAPAPTR